jgi:DNA-binding transcriptional MerR regulator
MYLSSGEVCEIFDIEHRLLDYWARSGLVTPAVPAEGRGSRRKWSVADAVKVGLIVEFTRRGVPVQFIRKHMAGMWETVVEWERFGLTYMDAVHWVDVADIRETVERAFQRRFPEMEVKSGEE